MAAQQPSSLTFIVRRVEGQGECVFELFARCAPTHKGPPHRLPYYTGLTQWFQVAVKESGENIQYIGPKRRMRAAAEDNPDDWIIVPSGETVSVQWVDLGKMFAWRPEKTTYVVSYRPGSNGCVFER